MCVHSKTNSPSCSILHFLKSLTWTLAESLFQVLLISIKFWCVPCSASQTSIAKNKKRNSLHLKAMWQRLSLRLGRITSTIARSFSGKHDWLVVEPALWKIWKSIGSIIPNIYIYGKKIMFQTTNQMTFVSQEWSFLIAQQTSLRYRNWKQQDLGCEATKFKDPKQLRKTMRTLPLLPCKIGLITCDVFPSFLL